MGKKQKKQINKQRYEPWPERFGEYTYKTSCINENDYVLHAYLGYVQPDGEFKLPVEVNGHRISSFTDNFARTLNGISKLVIPGEFDMGDSDDMGDALSLLFSVSEFYAEPGSIYKTIDGVLFRGTELIKYPPLKDGKTYTIPIGTTHISKSAFFGARNLVSIVIPDTVEEIKEEAFGNCYNLSSIIIPESVQYMDDYLFTDCLSLKTVIIESCGPEIYISGSDFIGCQSLQSIFINQDNPEYCVFDGVVYMRPGTYSLLDKKHVRDDYRLVYYPADRKDESFIIPSNVGFIGAHAFINNRHLKKIQAYALPAFNEFSFAGSPFDISKVEIISDKEYDPETPNKTDSNNFKDDSTSKGIVDLEYIYPDTIITVADNFLCMSNGHHLKDKRVKIRMIDNRNRLIDIPIEVGYCIECNRFYMYSDFFKRDVEPLYYDGWKIVGTQFQLPNMKIIGYKIRRDNGAMATESILKLCGYTVGYNSPLTASDRHSILQGIIDKGLLGRQEIMSYLNHFIEFNGRTPSKDMSKAVADWEEDLHNL